MCGIAGIAGLIDKEDAQRRLAAMLCRLELYSGGTLGHAQELKIYFGRTEKVAERARIAVVTADYREGRFPS